MRIFKQKFSSILLAIVFLVGAISTVNFALKIEAASQAVGDLTIEYPSAPLFNAQNIAPGYEEIKTITVINNGTIPHNFSLALSGAAGDLGEVLQFEPRNFDTQVPYWNHTLSEIAASPDGFVILNPINPGQTVKIDLAAILPESIGNDYMGKSVTTFGIILSVDSSFESPIIPVFGPTGEETGVITGGGAVETGTTPLTYGGRRIGLLGPTGTGAEEQTIEPAIEQPKEEGIINEQAETKGEEMENKIWCYWWWILLIILALFLIIYGAITYNKEIVFAWIWPILAGILVYVIHLILHRYYTPVKWCDYFIWIDLGELIVYFILYSYFRNKALNEEE